MARNYCSRLEYSFWWEQGLAVVCKPLIVKSTSTWNYVEGWRQHVLTPLIFHYYVWEPIKVFDKNTCCAIICICKILYKITIYFDFAFNWPVITGIKTSDAFQCSNSCALSPLQHNKMRVLHLGWILIFIQLSGSGEFF